MDKFQTLNTGSESLTIDSKPIGKTIGDFWSWSASNLLGNTLRGVFGEFIVASALEIKLKHLRTEWQPYDFEYDNHKIEVKTSAYIQTWGGDKKSTIQFGIALTRYWDAESGKFTEEEPKRHADIYVFGLLNCEDKNIVNPLNMSQWVFYVLHTSTLNERCPNQRTIGLTALGKLQPYEADYAHLKKVVDSILKEKPLSTT